MPKFLAQFIPLAIFGLSFLALFAVIHYWEWQTKRARKKSPLTSDLLRGPGEALREKLEEIRFDLLGYMLFSFVLPLWLYASYVSIEMYGNKPSTFLFLFHVVLGLIAIGYPLFKMLGLQKLKRQYALGLEAEVAVGQELNHLMRDGYWVYHDFPADDFNIDHVVIGPTGVFAVETKGRAKSIKDDGSTEREVIYDGEVLQFPSRKESKPIKQASLQAKWLQQWLSSAVGEPVTVHPVLALPGWFIKKVTPGGVPVINGKNPKGFFSKYGNSHLSEKLQQQIVHQVDQRCRNILPRAYKTS